MASFFMDGFNCLKVRATLRRQFTFYHQVPRNSWYSLYQPQTDEGLSRPWNHPVVLNMVPLDWESIEIKLLQYSDLILSWWRLVSYRNQSIELLCKSMDWFCKITDSAIRVKIDRSNNKTKIKNKLCIQNQIQSPLKPNFKLN